MKKEIKPKIELKELLGTPKKGIIFSDLDGVWFDESRNFASPAPSELSITKEAQAAGFWIVLVSDTGTNALSSYSQELGCNPIVIGENGAVVYLPGNNVKEYLTPLKPFFDRYRIEAIEALKANDSEAEIVDGDATTIIKSGNLRGKPCQTLYVVNDARECSFGVYTRVCDEQGTPKVDDEKTIETERILKSLLGEIDNGVVAKRYPEIGSCLVKDPSIVKWKAVEWFINQFKVPLSFYMIGDTINDSMEKLADRITTCAVGNAAEDLKSVALKTGGIVAPEEATIAKGANFIIKQILGKEQKK